MNIKDTFGGNFVQGISESKVERTVIVASDPLHNGYGYKDQDLPDGSYEFFGQAPRDGDPWANNNHMVRDHVARGRSLLLFVEDNDEYFFRGEYLYNGHRLEQRVIRGIEGPQVIFNLIRADAAAQPALQAAIDNLFEVSIDDLRERAIAAGNPNPERDQQRGATFRRSVDVSAYVLRRAKGECEGCGKPGPFKTRTGQLYLECHHIDKLADCGPDDIYSVIALCPTCHRFVHHAEGGAERNEEFREKMLTIEPRDGN
jgi:5-methylcytosine-specific restriction protein A